MLLQSLSLPIISSNSLSKIPKPHPLSPSSHPPLYLKFRTTHREDFRYLKTIGVVDPTTKQLPSPDATAQLLATVNFLKSKGFSDPDFARIAFLCPRLFSLDFDITDIEPVFDFFATDLQASLQQSRGLVIHCPQILLSDVEYCLRQTLNYLRQLGLEKLNVPSYLNAHLLNIRVEKLHAKVMFLKSIGLSQEEAARSCARMPAILKYSVDNNLRPKVNYLVGEMERSLDDLKEFPQYFGFSLEKRIVPRHLHLKERNERIKLKKMLLWSDEKFYAKWQ